MSEDRHLGIVSLLGNFHRARIVVLGDVMLDEYWWGSVERISPEAPVPVVSVERRETKLGGAANVARNIGTLGGTVTTVGVVGDDAAGETVRARLEAEGLPTGGLIIDRTRPTTLKTRVVAHSQQVVRADFESTEDVSAETAAALVESCRSALKDAAGVVISDYGKGVIGKRVLDQVAADARAAGKFIVVDPKDAHFSVYKQVTSLTPNHHEAAFMAGRRIRDAESLRAVGFGLLKQLQAGSLLITRGEHGMALFEPPGRLTLIPTVAKRVYDVTGAGDTVIAAVAVALAAGGTMLQAAYTANVAAGEVIKEVGTACTTVDAIREALCAIPEPGVTVHDQNGVC